MLARQSLAMIYGERALTWRIEPQPSGALCVCGEHGSMPAISLSHSNGRVVCAVAETALLGIDIERIQPRKSLKDLAVEVLHPYELAEFQQLEAESRLEFFYERWVLKEALGKALGHGVNYPMREVLINDDRLVATPQPWTFDSGSWWFSHTLLDGEYSLGLACQGCTDNSISICRIEIRI
jgi:4'-phosphopantetheinyl transferase